MSSSLTTSPWSLPPSRPDLVAEIQEEMGYSRAFAAVLANRYGDSYRRVEQSQSSDLHEPVQLRDLETAVERIAKALSDGEKIFIHGDFDVDGLSSSALLYRGLKQLSDSLGGDNQIKVEVGNRRKGHGLDPLISSRLIESNYDILITTDCGIKAGEEVSHLQSNDVDVIITDHHEPGSKLPPALATIDPKRKDSNYPNKHLSGSGISFQLIRALNRKYGSDEIEGTISQLAMLGTVTDMVPLVNNGEQENKLIVKKGLEKLNDNPVAGLKALAEKSGLLGEEITTRSVSFRLAPKLNSANRVGDPKVSFLLLTTNNPKRADYLAEILLDYDRDRSTLQSKIYRSAREQIKSREVSPEKEGIVYATGEEWNPGILGLVASKLCNRYHLPAAIITCQGSSCKGSIRSIEGVNIVNGLEHCSNLLKGFGGHEMAGGFQIHRNNIDKFVDRLSSWIIDQLEGTEQAEQDLELDAELQPEELNLALLKEQKLLEPFGVGNPKPKYLLRDAPINSFKTVGKKDDHLKLDIANTESCCDCIGFGMAKHLERGLSGAGKVDLIFKISRDTWQGGELQLELEDLFF